MSWIRTRTSSVTARGMCGTIASWNGLGTSNRTSSAIESTNEGRASMRTSGTLLVLVTTGTALCGQTLGRMTVDTSTDRMTGKPTAVVTWAAVDSVHSRYAYLPLLFARVFPRGKINIYPAGVPPLNRTREALFGRDGGS